MSTLVFQPFENGSVAAARVNNLTGESVGTIGMIRTWDTLRNALMLAGFEDVPGFYGEESFIDFMASHGWVFNESVSAAMSDLYVFEHEDDFDPYKNRRKVERDLVERLEARGFDDPVYIDKWYSLAVDVFNKFQDELEDFSDTFYVEEWDRLDELGVNTHGVDDTDGIVGFYADFMQVWELTDGDKLEFKRRVVELIEEHNLTIDDFED